MRTSVTLRAASLALVSLASSIGFGAQIVLSAPINQPPVVQPLATQSVQSGTVIKSPNGHFSLSVTDDGILLQGPGGSVHIDESQVEVKSQNVKVTSSGLVNVTASARVQLTSSQVDLNGTCAPIARYGDAIVTFAPVGPSPGMITSGSPTVLAC